MLELTVQVPADEWAYNKRRVVYLESLLLRVVREKCGIQEWFSADDLTHLRLPGLPPTRAGIARHAKAAGWRRQLTRDGGGERYVYHVTSLPNRAFDALLAMIIGLGDLEAEIEMLPDFPTPPRAEPMPANTAPVWVLPLMRLIKGSAEGDLGRAWSQLPKCLPPGTAVPTVEEAATVLVNLGLVKA